MSKTPKLKPCPFCGTRPRGASKYKCRDEDWYCVKCPSLDCVVIPVTSSYLSAEAAREAWNTRKGDKP